ncbi:LuxR C-terminal-related transcriptional regulator [Trujillonella humicola]|uniref:LuxR C-terminal-related transcriptional regulator n=1 Tax=Trujillonella humicola TaxID=3383699 RepID=UPI0039064FB4
MSTAVPIEDQPLADDPLLAAKLAAPHIRTPIVDRPRLTERVSSGVDGLLTVVSGAAGSGKTLLLASWCTTAGPPGPVAWLTLDPDDDAPGVFWAYVIAALRRAGVRLPPEVAEPFLGGSVTHHLLATLADSLATGAVPVVLVLDQFEAVTSRQVHREIDFVLRHADGTLRLVLLSRDDGAGWLHRYALRGDLVRIRNADLAFTREEAGDLLRLHGVRISAGTLSALAEQTRGWAAGLRLSAVALQQRREPDAFVAGLPGADPALTGYLVEDVLDAQPPDVRDFLLLTCVVDRVCPALADALTGRTDGEGVLARLATGNVLTTAVEHAPGWFAYHPMLAQVLQGELDRERPISRAELHRRAAVWLEDAGQFVEAVRHASAARDWQLAAAVVVRQLGVGPLLVGGGTTQLDAVLTDLPATAGGPLPAVVRSARALTAFDLDTCRAQVALADEQAGEATGPDRAPLLASTAVIRAILARVHGDPGAAESALAAGEEQLSGIPDAEDHPELRALLLSSVDTTQLWAGQLDEAERTLRRGLVASSPPGCRYPRLNVLGRLALLEYLRGRLGRAADLGRAEVALADDAGLPVAHRTGAGHLALALVAVEQGDQAGTRRHLDGASRSVGARHDPLVAVLVPMLRALWYADGRDLRRALSSLADVPGVVGGRPLPSWLADRLAVTAARVHTERRDLAAATTALDGVVGPDPEQAVRRAAVALLGGDADGATALLSPVLAAEPAGDPTGTVEAWLLAAHVHLLDGRRPLAREALGRALALAEPERRRRLFLRPGAPGRTLLSTFPEVGRAHAWLAPAPAAGRGPGHPAEGGGGGEEAPVEALTDRERTVLARMAQAMSSDDIAGDLFVSLNTVKTHQRNIYRKLAVSRRNDAVRKARRLGLV